MEIFLRGIAYKFTELGCTKNKFWHNFWFSLYGVVNSVINFTCYIKRLIWNRGLKLIMFSRSTIIDDEAIIDMNEKETLQYFHKIGKNKYPNGLHGFHRG